MKFAALLLLAGTAAANNYPAFSAFRAHCQIDTTVNSDCQDVVLALKEEMTNFTDPAKQGLYEILEEAPDYVWVVRRTVPGKQVDDVIFELSDSGNGDCKLTGKSQAQKTTFFDDGTNFCNIYNVLRGNRFDFSAPQVSKCRTKVADPDTKCNTV